MIVMQKKNYLVTNDQLILLFNCAKDILDLVFLFGSIKMSLQKRLDMCVCVTRLHCDLTSSETMYCGSCFPDKTRGDLLAASKEYH